MEPVEGGKRVEVAAGFEACACARMDGKDGRGETAELAQDVNETTQFFGMIDRGRAMHGHHHVLPGRQADAGCRAEPGSLLAKTRQ